MKQRNILDSDDAQVGRILSRREVLALLGGSSVALIAACAPGALTSASPTATAQQTSAAATTAAAASSAAATVLPSCIVRPALTEGPYFVDEKLDRSDIRSDPGTGAVRPGALLTLNFLVSRVSGSACTALSGAVVDVWHCDALGVYSDVDNARGQKFLRGFQTTDASGSAKFTTVYPGWYQGRAVHIHFKIRTDAAAASGLEFTSQLFFDDALSAQVYSSGVYASKGTPDQPNASDGIYQQSQGMTLLDVAKDGHGYRATFEIAIQST
jgi:protocatechuate 3,4-dioxygenase beta subunit